MKHRHTDEGVGSATANNADQDMVDLESPLKCLTIHTLSTALTDKSIVFQHLPFLRATQTLQWLVDEEPPTTSKVSDLQWTVLNLWIQQ